VAPTDLEAHLMWYRAYYHFSRPHESVRLARTFTNAYSDEVVWIVFRAEDRLRSHEELPTVSDGRTNVRASGQPALGKRIT